MARDKATDDATDMSRAARFRAFDEQTQADLKREAWDAAVVGFRDENPEWYDELDSTDKVSWDDMELEIYQDENGRDYFHIVTGTTGGPGEPAKHRRELAVEFMNVYRDQLEARIGDAAEGEA